MNWQAEPQARLRVQQLQPRLHWLPEKPSVDNWYWMVERLDTDGLMQVI
jgi:hypothetical protein